MVPQRFAEIKLGYLLPLFFGLALLVNAIISQPTAYGLDGFAPIALHADSSADYGKDPLDLLFPPLDPAIMDAALQDQAGDPAAAGSSVQATPTPAPPMSTPTPTPLTDPIATAVDPIVTLVEPIVTLADPIIDDAEEILDPITCLLFCP